MYLALDRQDKSEILQKDLESLEKWEKLWDMSFNPSKCQVIHVTRCKNPFQTKYQRTNGPVNAHLISWPSKAQNIQNLENIW